MFVECWNSFTVSLGGRSSVTWAQLQRLELKCHRHALWWRRNGICCQPTDRLTSAGDAGGDVELRKSTASNRFDEVTRSNWLNCYKDIVGAFILFYCS